MPSSLAGHLHGSWRLIVKEVAAFGFVGAISFVVDIGIFNLLLRHGEGPIEAKTISSAVSTTFAYFGNRHLSFSHRARTSLGREAGFFFLINLVTLVGSLLALALFAYPLHFKFDKVVMNVVNLATIGLGTIFRFDAYKRFVFLHPDKVHLARGTVDGGTVDGGTADGSTVNGGTADDAADEALA